MFTQNNLLALSHSSEMLEQLECSSLSHIESSLQQECLHIWIVDILSVLDEAAYACFIHMNVQVALHV